MPKEKILAFLNLNVNQPIEKFIMKLFAWFHISFSVVICLFSLLFPSRMMWFSIATYVFSAITSAAAFLSIRFLKNPVWQWIHPVIVICCSELVILYGWYTSSEGEGLSKFTWAHLTVLCILLGMSAYIIVKLVWAYRLLETNTIERAQAILQKRASEQKIPKLLAIVACCPILFARFLKDPLKVIGLGLGFWYWALACAMMLFVLIFIPRIIIICKYKVYQWFQMPNVKMAVNDKSASK